jgi:hypothetical protein
MRGGKEQLDARKLLTKGGVTVNQKTISRRSFSQVIHIDPEHNFWSFLFASLPEIPGRILTGDFP